MGKIVNIISGEEIDDDFNNTSGWNPGDGVEEIPSDIENPIDYIQNDLDSKPDQTEVDRFFRDLFSDKIEVKINPLVNDIKDFCIPFKGSEGAACLDVKAVSITKIDEETVEVGLGFCTEIPDGYKGIILPRSSISKFNWIIPNSPCIVDQDYRGEWKVRFNRIGDNNKSFPYSIGDRIAQIYFDKVNPVQFVVTDELSETKRGDESYGSTGL